MRPHSQSHRLLRLYVERFNRQDWDGLREPISADARLLVADRHLRDGAWDIAGVVKAELGADRRIHRIADYQNWPWVLTAGSIVVRESVR